MTTEAGTVRPPAGAQAVRRALDVLHCFHDNGPDLSASDLARRLGLSTSTAHRLARTLLGAGFLEQDARTARYRLGPAMTELGRLSYHQRGSTSRRPSSPISPNGPAPPPTWRCAAGRTW